MGQRTIGSLAGGGTEGGRERGRQGGRGPGGPSGGWEEEWEEPTETEELLEQQHSARNGYTPDAGTCSHTEPSYT